jgi:hypothetical protein
MRALGLIAGIGGVVTGTGQLYRGSAAGGALVIVMGLLCLAVGYDPDLFPARKRKTSDDDKKV